MTTDTVFDIADELRYLLCPNGSPIGEPGSTARIRLLTGDLFDARDLFNELAAFGNLANIATYPGDRVKIRFEIGFVGIRNMSGSGEPTIDVNVKIAGLDRIKKIKFVGWSL